MTYTKSDKRKARDKKQADWEKRMFVLMKRNQGWTFQRIGDYFGSSRDAMQKLYTKIKDMTIEELETEYQKYIEK